MLHSLTIRAAGEVTPVINDGAIISSKVVVGATVQYEVYGVITAGNKARVDQFANWRITTPTSAKALTLTTMNAGGIIIRNIDNQQVICKSYEEAFFGDTDKPTFKIVLEAVSPLTLK